jgi:hypothetical protein
MRILGALIGLSLALAGCVSNGGPAAYGLDLRHPSSEGGGGGYHNSHPCWDCIANRQKPPYRGAN